MVVVSEIHVIIPAFNEARTVASVVQVARAAGFTHILVVSDGSTDQTATEARNAGAEVLELHPNRGKGGAVLAGAQHCQSEYVLLLDADLLNLTATHLQNMLEPINTGTADTTAGLFQGGGVITDIGNRGTPHWSGQRIIPRQTILHAKDIATAGYGIEIALNNQIKLEQLRLQYVNLIGASQIIKEQKLGVLAGILRRLKMYWQILRYSRSNRQH